MAWDWLLRPVLLLFIIIFILQFHFTSPLSESDALIKLKNSFTNATALSSWLPGSAPCGGATHWDGLVCSTGIVVGIRLTNMGLSGEIDVDALADLLGLRSVSFEYNSFSGPIPEFNRLGYLKNIYLTGNLFSGEIPEKYFLNMDSLKKVWLAKNKFSGEIPASLVQLSSLIELHLEDNQFSGTIPPVMHTRLKAFNVSNNKLTGEIPDGFVQFRKDSFGGNVDLCGDIIGKECSVPSQATPPEALLVSTSSIEIPSNTGSNIKKTGAGVIALAVMLFFIAIVIICKMRSDDDDYEDGKDDNDDQEEVETIEVQVSMPIRQKEIELNKKPAPPTRREPPTGAKGGVGELTVMNNEKGAFGLMDLMKAAAEVLGNGGLGSSYKVLMANGLSVVVKRLREMNALGKDGFDAQMRKLGKLRHTNVLSPLAFHYRKDEKLLIYEYIPKGSLLYLLHGDKKGSHSELKWPARLKIVQGIARGLGYLHTELASSDLPHGNLKSSNILISPDNEPMLSEFGFSPMVNPSALVQALLAYKAPEVTEFRVSPKCDVYCLGLIILEILTGKYPYQYLNDGTEGIDLVKWAETKIAEGKEHEMLDPEIASSSNSLGEMKQLVHIGALCAATDPMQRLDLREAIQRIEMIKLENVALEHIQVLPSLRDGIADAPKFNAI